MSESKVQPVPMLPEDKEVECMLVNQWLCCQLPSSLGFAASCPIEPQPSPGTGPAEFFGVYGY